MEEGWRGGRECPRESTGGARRAHMARACRWNNGPPESPWHASLTVPMALLALLAQIIGLAAEFRVNTKLANGSCQSPRAQPWLVSTLRSVDISTSACLPSSEVSPHPTTVAFFTSGMPLSSLGMLMGQITDPITDCGRRHASEM